MNAPWRCRELFIPYVTDREVRCTRWRFHRKPHRAQVTGELRIDAHHRSVDMSGWAIHHDAPIHVSGSYAHFSGGHFIGSAPRVGGSSETDT